MSSAGKREVVIVGAGGFSRELLQYITDLGGFTVRGFLDDRDPDELQLPEGSRLIGTIKEYAPSASESLALAVGEPVKRAEIARYLLQHGAKFETIVHPKAYVASSAKIGEGSIIAPFATVGAMANIGALAQVHFYASVAHDAVVGSYSALSPYSVVNGGGRLGEGVFLGTRATVNPLRSVGEYSKVAAGAVVYRDVPSGSLAAGNPAKFRRLMLPHETASDNSTTRG